MAETSCSFCTVVARSQLANARVLAASLARHHPRHPRLAVLVLDDRDQVVGAEREPFDVIRPVDLEIDRFEALAACVARDDLVAALRPSLIAAVLERRDSPVLLLPHDALVIAPLDPLATAASSNEFVLVPRMLRPAPPDRRRPNDVDLLVDGLYESSLVAARPTSLVYELLGRWRNLTREAALGFDPNVARRWLDLAPAIGESVGVVRDPGVGLSPWNFHERLLHTRDNALWAGAFMVRLVCFDRGALYRWGEQARSVPAAVEELWRRYEHQLREAGDDASRRVEYSYAKLADGTPVDAGMRYAIRVADGYGGLPEDPFSAEGTAALYAWLNAPADVGRHAGLTQYWSKLYLERADVREAFPDIDGADAARFVDWIRDHGRAELRSPRRLMTAL